SESRNQVVFGSGNTSAELLFIGDAPDRDEDEQGMPTVGRSGALFERMIAAIGMDREQVYWLHSVKCRPLHSRDPKPEEFQACQSWLLAQLDFIQPRLICVLGRVAAQALLQTDDSLSDLRAQQHTFRGIPVVVLDHPAYLLRSQQHKARAWQDLLRLQSLCIR
ncbi:MAG: uracil-DNA glycosylase, partial [Ghiorsea sp.]